MKQAHSAYRQMHLTIGHVSFFVIFVCLSRNSHYSIVEIERKFTCFGEGTPYPSTWLCNCKVKGQVKVTGTKISK